MERDTYIGSSDAGPLLGADRYSKKIDVWQSKTGQKEEKEWTGNHIDRGNAMEPIIEKWVREEIDSTLNSEEAFEEFDQSPDHSYQITLQHEDYPFVAGHPDGIGDILYEFKAPAMRNVEKMLKTGVKKSWEYQVRHLLSMTPFEQALLVVWDYDEWEGIVFEFLRDYEFEEWMLSEYEFFWQWVQMGIKPPPTEPWEKEHMEIIEDEELDNLLGEYYTAMRQRYDGKDRQKRLKSKILTLADDRETLVTPNYRATLSYDVDMGNYTIPCRLTVTEADA